MEKPAYTLEFEKPLRDLTEQLDALRQQSLENNLDLGSEIAGIKKKIEATQRDIYTGLTPWQRVQIARHPRRPYALDYVSALFTGFQELHGDRCFGDDQALIGGTAWLISREQWAGAGLTGGLALGFYSGNIYSAVNSAHRYNQRQQRAREQALAAEHELWLELADEGAHLDLRVGPR